MSASDQLAIATHVVVVDVSVSDQLAIATHVVVVDVAVDGRALPPGGPVPPVGDGVELLEVLAPHDAVHRLRQHAVVNAAECRRRWRLQGLQREREMFYLTTHSTHFIYGYMASDIWLRTILTVRKETCCCHIGYSYRLTARVLLYAPSHRQDNTYHGLCYTSRGALARTRNSSMGPPHEGSIRRSTTP